MWTKWPPEWSAPSSFQGLRKGWLATSSLCPSYSFWSLRFPSSLYQTHLIMSPLLVCPFILTHKLLTCSSSTQRAQYIPSVALHRGQLHHHALFVSPNEKPCTMALQSCEVPHHLSIITTSSKPCDCLCTCSSSCLLPILHVLVYRHFIQEFDGCRIPAGVGGVKWHTTVLSFGYVFGCLCLLDFRI